MQQKNISQLAILSTNIIRRPNWLTRNWPSWISGGSTSKLVNLCPLSYVAGLGLQLSIPEFAVSPAAILRSKR